MIQAPKTESGIRYVPMSEEVVAYFRHIFANRVVPKAEPTLNVYTHVQFDDAQAELLRVAEA